MKELNEFWSIGISTMHQIGITINMLLAKAQELDPGIRRLDTEALRGWGRRFMERRSRMDINIEHEMSFNQSLTQGSFGFKKTSFGPNC